MNDSKRTLGDVMGDIYLLAKENPEATKIALWRAWLTMVDPAPSVLEAPYLDPSDKEPLRVDVGYGTQYEPLTAAPEQPSCGARPPCERVCYQCASPEQQASAKVTVSRVCARDATKTWTVLTSSSNDLLTGPGSWKAPRSVEEAEQRDPLDVRRGGTRVVHEPRTTASLLGEAAGLSQKLAERIRQSGVTPPDEIRRYAAYCVSWLGVARREAEDAPASAPQPTPAAMLGEAAVHLLRVRDILAALRLPGLVAEVDAVREEVFEYEVRELEKEPKR